MKKDDIKTLIVVIIICAICLLLVLIFSQKKQTDKLTDVEEYSTYFSISNYMNTYFDYVAKKDNKAIYSMLYSDYIYQNNINQNNIFDIIPTYDNAFQLKLKIENLQEAELNNNNYIYYIKGNIISTTFEDEEIIDNNYQILLLADYSTLSEAVYPVTDDNYQEIINKIKKIQIDQNEYNKIKPTQALSNESICVLYLSDYVGKLNTNINEAYKLLNEKTKSHYPTLNTFKNYVDDNITKITTRAAKCNKEKNVYTVIDENGGKYTFTEEAVMKYKVDIDYSEKENIIDNDSVEENTNEPSENNIE